MERNEKTLSLLLSSLSLKLHPYLSIFYKVIFPTLLQQYRWQFEMRLGSKGGRAPARGLYSLTRPVDSATHGPKEWPALHFRIIHLELHYIEINTVL